MIADLNDFTDDITRTGDICIIGAGAAGITLALELARAGHKVVLCEAGGWEETQDSQACYRGEVHGDPLYDLEYARLRYLGGSTNHWAGWCRTFDAFDFDRSYVAPEHKWPITRDDLDPFLDGARDILDLKTDFRDRPPDALGIRPIEFNFSPPTRFRDKFRDALEGSDRIDLVLNANLIGCQTEGDRIASARFSAYSWTYMTVEARHFILAMGGIDNSRLLLWLQRRDAAGLLAPALPIGRYWMEHPHYTIGQALVRAEVHDQFNYGTSQAFQRDQGIMNASLRVDEVPHTFTRALLEDLKTIAPTYAARANEQVAAGTLFGAELRAVWEQEPRRDNAVSLSAFEKDIFDIPHTVLEWRKSALDRRTIRASAGLFANWLVEKDLGRARLAGWLVTGGPYPDDDELAGYHHMGGTRMGTDPAVSVVDADCRVHGTANLFVAGSSVFTTSGFSNPTLPIVQLALRLGAHLARA